MRGFRIVVTLMALMLMVPVHGSADLTAMQQSQNDEEQPDANNTTLRIWSNGNQNHWSHFGSSDDQNDEENIWYGESSSSTLTVDLKFTMKPTLTKRLNMTVGEDIVGKIKVRVNGDYQDGGDGNCNNDCSNLTLKLKSGATTLHEQEYAPALGSDTDITFTYTITEEESLWDKSSANPSLHVYMKLKGNEQTGFFGTTSGQAAEFTLYLSGDNSSKIEFPIDPSSWNEAFQSDEMPMPVETPGFTLVAGAAAMGMAAVWFRPRPEEHSDD
jgi:hypothetical protein